VTIVRLLLALWKPLAALLGGAWLYSKGKQDALAGAENDTLRANEEAQKDGNNAVAYERRIGGGNADLVERLRKREGEWR
jgi:hypothetical protein